MMIKTVIVSTNSINIVLVFPLYFKPSNISFTHPPTNNDIVKDNTTYCYISSNFNSLIISNFKKLASLSRNVSIIIYCYEKIKILKYFFNIVSMCGRVFLTFLNISFYFYGDGVEYFINKKIDGFY